MTTTGGRDVDSRFRLGFEHAAIGMSIRHLDGRYVEVNPALCRILGREPVELVGRHPNDFTHPDDIVPEAGVEEQMRSAGAYHAEKRYIRPDGSVVWAQVDVSLARDPNGDPQYFFGQVQDISARKRVEQELLHNALHDSLTGLPNRALLLDRLDRALLRARRNKSLVAVLLVDVDHFKLVNDSLGHAAGDLLLEEIARRLRESLRAADTVARFGGDEFVVVCEGATCEADALIVAQRLAALFEAPAQVGGAQHYLTMSIGVALGRAEDGAQKVLSQVDAAMYRAKARGRARAELFDESLRLDALARLELKTALRQVTDDGGLTVAYQPVVSLRDGALLGGEALVRWEDACRGHVPPSAFIPIAEEAGLIGQIGRQVLSDALREVQCWRERVPGGSDLWVAVNLSARQLQDREIVGLLAGALDDNGSCPQSLHVEVTESLLVDEPDRCVANLNAIRELGIAISLDDFGTGYSSLAFLKHYPVDTIKVDRSFLSGLGTDAHDTSIVAAMVGLGRALGLHVLAEGIETPDQLRRLRALGCDQGQGYLWSQALTSDEFVAWATAHNLHQRRRQSGHRGLRYVRRLA